MKVSRVGLYGLPLSELGMRSKFDRSGTDFVLGPPGKRQEFAG